MTSFVCISSGWPGSCPGVACAGSGLEDLAAPVQQQFEELRVTNPRLYFSHTQPPPQQPASQQPQQSHLHDAGRKPPGGAQQQQQQQDVVAILRSIDVNALSDRPMEPAVANKVREPASATAWPRFQTLGRQSGSSVCYVVLIKLC